MDKIEKRGEYWKFKGLTREFGGNLAGSDMVDGMADKNEGFNIKKAISECYTKNFKYGSSPRNLNCSHRNFKLIL